MASDEILEFLCALKSLLVWRGFAFKASLLDMIPPYHGYSHFALSRIEEARPLRQRNSGESSCSV